MKRFKKEKAFKNYLLYWLLGCVAWSIALTYAMVYAALTVIKSIYGV